MKPAISVVISAYNEEKNLSRCLKGLKNQDFDKPFEIILVDNYSTDKTTEIGKKFGCRVIREPRKGQTFAKQRGCLEAKGDIIAVLDADNLPPKNWLLVILNGLQDKNVVGITCAYDYDYDYGKLSNLVKLYRKIYFIPMMKITSKLFGAPPAVVGGNVAFKKKIFMKFGGYDVKIKSLSETEIGLGDKLKMYGKVKYAPGMEVKTIPRIEKKGFMYLFYRFAIKAVGGYYLEKYFRKSFFSDMKDVR